VLALSFCSLAFKLSLRSRSGRPHCQKAVRLTAGRHFGPPNSAGDSASSTRHVRKEPSSSSPWPPVPQHKRHRPTPSNPSPGLVQPGVYLLAPLRSAAIHPFRLGGIMGLSLDCYTKSVRLAGGRHREASCKQLQHAKSLGLPGALLLQLAQILEEVASHPQSARGVARDCHSCAPSPVACESAFRNRTQLNRRCHCEWQRMQSPSRWNWSRKSGQ
jgi:hypothetical protein